MEPVRSLVMRAAAADADRAERVAAFSELVRRFQDMAYGYAYAVLGDPHQAEDATQEAFLAAYRRLPQLREPAAFAGWLRRIVRTACHRQRRRADVVAQPLAAAELVPGRAAEPGAAAERTEMRQGVLEAIRSLPAPQRTVTTLFYIDGYSQKDIAGFLELPVTTVNNRLHASRKRLKRRMLKMVRETLRSRAPDERFSEKVIRELLDRPRPLEIDGHPVREAAEAIFAALDGYERIEGPEVVDPAAFVGISAQVEGVYRTPDGRILRPETTVTTFEAIRGRTPPVRLATAGRVFRTDPEDATHRKVFHQFEAICIDAGVDVDAMRATLARAVRSVLGPTELRWDDQAHFDFVDSPLELAVRRGRRWLDIAGCGLLKAETLRRAGHDPEAIGGFAFGLGLERLAMLAHGIDDIGALWRPPYVPR